MRFLIGAQYGNSETRSGNYSLVKGGITFYELSPLSFWKWGIGQQRTACWLNKGPLPERFHSGGHKFL